VSNAFFISPDNVNGNSFALDKRESHHASNVFRLGPGDVISLLNGKGLGYKAIIEGIDGGIVYGRIEKLMDQMGENSIEIIIAPALLKRDRFEALIEKATELGVKEIHPLVAEHCTKRTVNIERCKKIIIASAKQCQRSHFTIIKEPSTMVKWLNKPRKQCFAGVISAESRLKKFSYNKNLPIYILIGPEGDFSLKELDLMKELGVKLFSLGNRKLRAETAAQATLSILNELLD
tara:strand:- start:856 stop:1557 length:702 start_codon:yes stop_codon:yes gene_type:complete